MKHHAALIRAMKAKGCCEKAIQVVEQFKNVRSLFFTYYYFLNWQSALWLESLQPKSAKNRVSLVIDYMIQNEGKGLFPPVQKVLGFHDVKLILKNLARDFPAPKKRRKKV